MSTQNPERLPADEPVVLTVRQSSAMLQVSENHLRALIARGEVPHFRCGKLIRIPRWGLLQYIAIASGAPLVEDGGVALLPPQSVHVHQPAKED